jgi:hypothetical protein
LTVDSWIDLTALSSPNSEEEVLKRGFQFGANSGGGKFFVGRIQTTPSENTKIIKRFLLCKVAIGRAYYAAEDYAKVAPMPDGYDSFFLENLENPDKESPINNLTSNYIVKDGSQVLPTFLVTFEYDPQLEQRSRQQQHCDNCESAEATVYCQADNASLCSNCDSAMHNSKLAARHIRTPLEAGPQAISHCRIHGDKFVEFFCPTCSKPVCVHCKMIGHHSVGEAAKHKLITVSEAYKGVSEAAKAADPLVVARKNAIKNQQAALTERAKQVETNSAEIQVQLEELFKKASADLKAITRRKLNVLKGDSAELQRQQMEIAALEEFLTYCGSGGNATQFILDWAHHQRLRAELHAFSFFREGIDVLPDIRINGNIQVHIDSIPSASSSAFASPNTPPPTHGLSGAGEERPRYSPSRSALSRPSVSSKRSEFLSETLQQSMLSMSSRIDLHHNSHNEKN